MGFLAAGCGLRPDSTAPRPDRLPVEGPTLRLPPVHVSEDRVIRTVAGLRPYRPGGFVVKARRFGSTLVVHNYGHGGGGISLSWGTSSLAADLVSEALADGGAPVEADPRGREGSPDEGRPRSPILVRSVAVLGAGVMGLTAARLLQDRGLRVTLYARDLPPHTTSNVAGGQWSPFTVFDTATASDAFLREYEEAARRAHRRFQTMVGARYGVRWIDNYALRSAPRGPREGPIADLFMNEEELGPGRHPFPSPYAARFTTLFVEPNVFLPALLDEFLLRGGRIRRQAFHALEEVLALPERVVVNCTGMGTRDLFGDEELIPIKGQLVVLLPQPEVDYISLAGGSYMFPRADGILLGGSQERGEWSREPDPGITARILEGNRTVFDGMKRVLAGDASLQA